MCIHLSMHMQKYIVVICVQSHLEQCDEGVMQGLLCFLKSLYTCVTSEGQLIHLAESVLTSNLPLNILVTRAQWRLGHYF